MKKSPRYRTSHLIEDQFGPCSNDQVLKKLYKQTMEQI